MLNLVLFGPPGSGKGTQSEKIIEKFNLLHLSTGDILRAEIDNKTKLGLEAGKIICRGELVSDEIVIEMIKNRLESNQDAKGYIFDGFPRTVAQAEALDQLLDSFGQEITSFLSLVVEKEELVSRLVKRGEASGRSDDNLEIIENRISVYHKQTAVVADFYNKQGKLRSIEGMGSVDDIFERIESEINKL